MEILTSDITEGCVKGKGVFDEIQKATNAHLLEEYKKNRITGPEYSQAYLGGLQSSLQQAIQYLLGRQVADKQAELIAEQTNTEVIKQDLLLAQIDEVKEKIKLLAAQIDKTVMETTLLTEKIVTEGLVQEKLKIEIEVLKHQVNEAEAKVWIARAQTQDDLQDDVGPNKDIDARDVYGNTDGGGVLGSNIAVIRQKRVTELAQTNGLDPVNDGGAGVNEYSVLGKEISLRHRQAEGFIRNVEQQAAKIVADGHSMIFTTLDGVEEGYPAIYQPANVSAILQVAADSVNSHSSPKVEPD